MNNLVSVIVPAFNEEGNIAELCRLFEELVRQSKHQFELLLIDDGSTDGTYNRIKEAGEKYLGKRLFLTKIREEKDTELAHKLHRRKYSKDPKGPLFLVFFRIDKILPLIGAGEEAE